MISVYQDRLGTNTGKQLKKDTDLSQQHVRRVVALAAQQLFVESRDDLLAARAVHCQGAGGDGPTGPQQVRSNII